MREEAPLQEAASVVVAVGVACVAVVAAAAWWRHRAKTKKTKASPKKEKPWAASAKKGANSYYFAHHTRLADGLDASDYRMNGPRRLDPRTKRPLDDDDDDDDARGPATNSAPRAPGDASARTRGGSNDARNNKADRARHHRLTQYSWSDTETHVSIYVDPPGWNWDDLQASVELDGPTALTVTVAHPTGETYALVLTRLRAPVTEATKRQTKKRLTVKLKKRDSTLAWDKKWDTLTSTRLVGGAAGDDDDADADSRFVEVD